MGYNIGGSFPRGSQSNFGVGTSMEVASSEYQAASGASIPNNVGEVFQRQINDTMQRMTGEVAEKRRVWVLAVQRRLVCKQRNHDKLRTALQALGKIDNKYTASIEQEERHLKALQDKLNKRLENRGGCLPGSPGVDQDASAQLRELFSQIQGLLTPLGEGPEYLDINKATADFRKATWNMAEDETHRGERIEDLKQEITRTSAKIEGLRSQHMREKAPHEKKLRSAQDGLKRLDGLKLKKELKLASKCEEAGNALRAFQQSIVDGSLHLQAASASAAASAAGASASTLVAPITEVVFPEVAATLAARTAASQASAGAAGAPLPAEIDSDDEPLILRRSRSVTTTDDEDEDELPTKEADASAAAAAAGAGGSEATEDASPPNLRKRKISKISRNRSSQSSSRASSAAAGGSSAEGVKPKRKHSKKPEAAAAAAAAGASEVSKENWTVDQIILDWLPIDRYRAGSAYKPDQQGLPKFPEGSIYRRLQEEKTTLEEFETWLKRQERSDSGPITHQKIMGTTEEGHPIGCSLVDLLVTLGRLDCLTALCQSRVCPDMTKPVNDDGDTVFHLLASSEEMEKNHSAEELNAFIELVKEEGLSVECLPARIEGNPLEGYTPLANAGSLDFVNLWDAFVLAGAEITKLDDSKEKMAPIHYAALCSEGKIMELALGMEKGFRDRRKTSGGTMNPEKLYPFSFLKTGTNKYTIFHLAADIGNKAICDLLRDERYLCEAALSHIDEQNKTPLNHAAEPIFPIDYQNGNDDMTAEEMRDENIIFPLRDLGAETAREVRKAEGGSGVSRPSKRRKLNDGAFFRGGTKRGSSTRSPRRTPQPKLTSAASAAAVPAPASAARAATGGATAGGATAGGATAGGAARSR